MKYLKSLSLTLVAPGLVAFGLVAYGLVAYGLITAPLAAHAQQAGTQPVLSATPVTRPPAATQPAATPAPAAPAGIGVSIPAAATETPTVQPAPIGQPGFPGSSAQAPATSAAVGTTVLPPGVTAANVPASYIIGPEDSIQVTVWKEPGLSGSLPVRPDGMISLPLIGDLPAAGLAPMQLSADITTRLKKFITDPNVTVTVLAVNSKRIFLVGEVQHIGAMPLTPGMTPLQAIASAGGLSAFANAKRIYILRGEQGKQQKIHFDYKKALKDGNEQGVTLASGDTIVVP